MCHTLGHRVGLLSWSHSGSRWRQRSQLSPQLCHSFRYHKHQCSPLFNMCCSFMCTSITAFELMLGDNDGRFLMDRGTGEVKLIQGVRDRLTTPALHLQVMVRLTYLVLVACLKDMHCTFLLPLSVSLICFSVCISHPGISE